LTDVIQSCFKSDRDSDLPVTEKLQCDFGYWFFPLQTLQLHLTDFIYFCWLLFQLSLTPITLRNRFTVCSVSLPFSSVISLLSGHSVESINYITVLTLFLISLTSLQRNIIH